MIAPSAHMRIFAYPAPCDLRRGFNGLVGIVERQLCRDPLAGDVFLFTNRLRTRAKVLYFDGSGLCILHKRLLMGRFAKLWDERSESGGLVLTPSELLLFLEGGELLERATHKNRVSTA
jgi:transposase